MQILQPSMFDPHSDQKGKLPATGATDLVKVPASDRDHPGVQPNPTGQIRQRRQWPQIGVQQVPARGQGFQIGTGPARLIKQAHTDRIHGQAPGREEPDMPPLSDVIPDLRARLQHKRFEAAVEQVYRGGQPDRASADYDHRQVGEDGGGTIETLRRQQLAPGLGCHLQARPTSTQRL